MNRNVPNEVTHQATHLLDETSGARLTRRSLIRRGIMLGISAPMIGALLAACADDVDDADTPDDPAVDPVEDPDDEDEPEDEPEDDAPDARSGGTLRFAIHRDPIGVEPHLAYGATTSSLQWNVYDSLLSYDEEGIVVPSLAESWETPDERSYIFHLRDDVTFHNGVPFTSDDVIFSFERMLDPEIAATRRPELSRMESFEAVDDYTVEVVLNEPYATFLAVLATNVAVIVNRDWDEEGGDYSTDMNGTGPFMFDSFEREVLYTLVKNPDYYETGLPHLDRIDLIPIQDDSARINALYSGEVDFAEYIPWQNMDEVDQDDRFILYKGFDVFNLVRLNVFQEPVDDPRVRQALNYAVDRDALITLAFGGQGRPKSVALISPDDPVWYNHELDGHWSYDPDRARELLAEAGYDDPSEISLHVTSAQLPIHLDTAQIVVQQLQDLGMQVTLETIDVPTLLEKRLSGDYMLMMDGLGVPWPDPDFYTEYFGTDGAAHAAGIGYSNPELDRLLTEGRSTLDPDERKAIYLQVEELLLEEAPFIFLYWRPQAEASTTRVNGYIRVPPLGLNSVAFMERIWLED